ncbi:MAG TPA: HEAT repeat domain-containing protein [Candidatus Dormibacteraeota bacterium]|nr:HEAT repeat domain-containing protein [Candidatus Dormibacteraeota bacterium]
MIHFETLMVTLGLLLGIVALTTIAAIANKVYSNREADSKRRFLDQLRRAFLSLRSPDGKREAMPVIVRSMTGRWSELAAEEISQLELPLRLDVLRELEEAGIVARLLRDAKSRLKWNRAHALRILGELKLPMSIPTLLHALDDKDPDVRNVAARALGRMKLQAAEEALIALLGKHDQAVSARIAAICIEMGPRTAPLLIKTLRDGIPKARFWAARILGEIADPRATRSISEALQDADPDVRSAAVWAIGSIADRPSAPIVAPLLNDPVWYVRAHAAEALGKIGDPSLTGALADALRDQSWWVRRNALEALVRVGEAAKPALMTALESEDRFARDSAVEALTSLGVTAIAPRREGA